MTYVGGIVSWHSILLKWVSTTTELEYIAAIDGGKEVLWMKNILQELGMMQKKYVMFCDSQSGIHLDKNSSYHS